VADKYYVIGGEYADTTFSKIADGKTEERHGPLSEREAHDLWRALTGKTVDFCLVRYRIAPDSDAVGEAWYVAGGEYATTEFNKIADQRKLEIYGPYPSRPEALAVWRAITGKTVDSAMTRYDIVTVQELDEIKKTA
jgi:hypothetical protein